MDRATVRCLHCRRLYRAVEAAHLRARHGYRGPHPVLAYKRRFGLEQAWSTATRQAIADGVAGRYGRRGRAWSRRRVLVEIRRRARRGISLAASDTEASLKLAGRRYFGGWGAAVEAARVPYEGVRKTTAWSRARVIREIRALRDRGEPLTNRHARRHHVALRRAAIRRFPSAWGRALKAAGVDPAAVHRPPSRWTPESAAAWVRRVARTPRQSLAESQAPTGLLAFVASQGLEWPAFVASLGVRPPGPPNRRWSKALVAAEIRRRHAAGKSLRGSSFRTDDANLYNMGRRLYGTWEAALRAAGRLKALEAETARGCRR